MSKASEQAVAEDGPRCPTFTADIDQIRRFLDSTYVDPFFVGEFKRPINDILPSGKGANEDILSETNPPAWVEEVLAEPAYYALMSHLHELYPTNQVLQYLHELCILNHQGRGDPVAEALAALAIETARTFGEDNDKFKYCPDFIPSYYPTIDKPTETFDVSTFSSQLEAAAYTESKRYTVVGMLHVDDVDVEFCGCLHQALNTRNLSEGILHKLWDTCINHPTPAVIVAARDACLIETLIDYVYITTQPKPNGLNPTTNKAIHLISCLANSTPEGKHNDVRAIHVYTRRLKDFYLTLALYFKEMLHEINPDRCCMLTSRIFVKYVHYHVKRSSYYESYMDSTSSPLLHTILIRLANRFTTLSPPILYCLFECLKPTPHANCQLAIGKHIFIDIIDHIITFFNLGLGELIIHLFNENLVSFDVSDLTYVIEEIFSTVKQPFTISFVAWILEWFDSLANTERYSVLESDLVAKFLQIAETSQTLVPTAEHPTVSAAMQEIIAKLNDICAC